MSLTLKLNKFGTRVCCYFWGQICSVE